MSPILNHDAGMIHFCQHVMFLWAQNVNIIYSMMNRNTVVKKLKIITVNKDPANLRQGHEDLWCVQTLTGAVSRWIQKQSNPLLAWFAENSPPNWVIHGSNAVDYISLTITSVSLVLLSKTSSHTATLLHKFKSTGLLFNLKTVCGSLHCWWDVYICFYLNVSYWIQKNPCID